MVDLQPFDKFDENISMDRCHIGKTKWILLDWRWWNFLFKSIKLLRKKTNKLIIAYIKVQGEDYYTKCIAAWTSWFHTTFVVLSEYVYLWYLCWWFKLLKTRNFEEVDYKRDMLSVEVNLDTNGNIEVVVIFVVGGSWNPIWTSGSGWEIQLSEWEKWMYSSVDLYSLLRLKIKCAFTNIVYALHCMLHLLLLYGWLSKHTSFWPYHLVYICLYHF